MRYQTGDAVTLNRNYVLHSGQGTIPKGSSGIVTKVISMADAYLVDFGAITKLLVPDAWLN